jgi:hypothetical protein
VRIFLVMLVGCATADKATHETPTPDGNTPPPSVDGNTDVTCTPMADLLMNGTFDVTPVGMGWTGTPANPMYPIITANGLTPNSPPDKAWMGSVVSASDEMHTDVVVPAKATGLVLEGFSQVRTTETASTANDTATIVITDTNDTMLESALALDNTNAGMTWVAFSHPLTSSVAGHALRVRFSSTNNATKATSFYFDTVSLKVTGCQ